MGRKGVDLQALVSPVFFNERMEEKLFFALCTQLYSTGSPLAQGRYKGLSWRDLIPTDAWGSGTSLTT